jgi:hypothetical protein
MTRFPALQISQRYTNTVTSMFAPYQVHIKSGMSLTPETGEKETEDSRPLGIPVSHVAERRFLLLFLSHFLFLLKINALYLLRKRWINLIDCNHGKKC